MISNKIWALGSKQTVAKCTQHTTKIEAKREQTKLTTYKWPIMRLNLFVNSNQTVQHSSGNTKEIMCVILFCVLFHWNDSKVQCTIDRCKRIVREREREWEERKLNWIKTMVWRIDEAFHWIELEWFAIWPKECSLFFRLSVVSVHTIWGNAQKTSTLVHRTNTDGMWIEREKCNCTTHHRFFLCWRWLQF